MIPYIESIKESTMILIFLILEINLKGRKKLVNFINEKKNWKKDPIQIEKS